MYFPTTLLVLSLTLPAFLTTAAPLPVDVPRDIDFGQPHHHWYDGKPHPSRPKHNPPNNNPFGRRAHAVVSTSIPPKESVEGFFDTTSTPSTLIPANGRPGPVIAPTRPPAPTPTCLPYGTGGNPFLWCPLKDPSPLPPLEPWIPATKKEK